ncbi:MAG: nicotinate-nucleotide adenylyltransferase, partial [Armatimonadota bacterium]
GEEFGLDTVIFVPAGEPWQKKAYSVTQREQRWKMTVLAIEGNEHFSASRIEIDRVGPSYTVDTIMQMLEERPGETPYFITGMDAVLQILTWRSAHELPGLSHFVAASRSGYDADGVREGLPAAFLERTSFLEMPLLEISSTYLRSRVNAGKSIRYLTPDRVRRFIESEGLYQSKYGSEI